MVLKGYIEGIISRDECKNYLIYLGYDENEAEFLLKLEEKKEEDRRIEEEIRTLKTRYIKGDITKEELERELTRLNLTQARIQKEILKIELARMRTVKLPTRSDLERFYRLKLIDDEQFRTYMKLIGYREQEIELYLEAIKKEGGYT